MPVNYRSIELAQKIGCCIIIPTYNNSQTLKSVIEDVRQYISDIIVVNDGATDSTKDILAEMTDLIVIAYMPNRGKGFAIRKGFKQALKMGFRYAITLDSDGQHKGNDIPVFLEKIQLIPDSLIVGSRLLRQQNMPNGNTFANNFSNFWFRLQTGINMPDTQSGFRLYPLNKISRISFITNRYEAELEILVRSAWRGIHVCVVPISVYYPPPEIRISHFRPFRDFFRISILNTFFTIIAFVYAYPVKLLSKLVKKGKYLNWQQ
jgi:glycosyltransferase involved in cell wall biosynthesis